MRYELIIYNKIIPHILLLWYLITTNITNHDLNSVNDIQPPTTDTRPYWKFCSSEFSNKNICHYNKYVLFSSSTSSTYIALQPWGVLDLSSTSPTCFNIHSIGWYGWKALSLSFSKLFADLKSVEYLESYEHECVCMFFSHLQHLWHT